MANVKEIIEAFAEEQGWSKAAKTVLLERFVDHLASQDQTVLNKLTIFLTEVQKTEDAPLLDMPFLSDEVRLFLLCEQKNGVKTLAQALDALAHCSPEMLADLMEDHLIETNCVESLDDLDLTGVYDDVAEEVDALEDEYGEDCLLADILNPKVK